MYERKKINKRSRRKCLSLVLFKPLASLYLAFIHHTPNLSKFTNHPTNRHTWGSVRIEKTIDVMTPPQSESAMANFQLHLSKVERLVKS